jgi:hypothetical protein
LISSVLTHPAFYPRRLAYVGGCTGLCIETMRVYVIRLADRQRSVIDSDPVLASTGCARI